MRSFCYVGYVSCGVFVMLDMYHVEFLLCWVCIMWSLCYVGYVSRGVCVMLDMYHVEFLLCWICIMWSDHVEQGSSCMLVYSRIIMI